MRRRKQTFVRVFRGPPPCQTWIPAAFLAACLAGLPALLTAQEPATGSLSGRVLDAGTDRPVGAVEIVLPELDRRTTTNGRGRFLLDDVPLGVHTLRVEHLGFASAEREVEVHGRFQSSLTVRLQREPVELEPLVASVERELRVRHLEREGFYERRDSDWGGDFFGPRHLTRWSGTRAYGIVQRAAGARVVRTGPGRRFQVHFYRSDIPAAVFVDGVKRGSTVPDIPSSEVAAVEVYQSPTRAVGAPKPVDRGGAVFIWTWRGPNPFHHVDPDASDCPLPTYRRHAC